MNMQQLIFLQLNEINFDIVRRYVEQGQLPHFKRLLSEFRGVETFAEAQYHELEPWIQWVSAQTGKTYSEHGVFRLGDIVNSDVPQIFETLESRNLTVGAISPMNARNCLRRPAYFVPDPWTDTRSDSSGFSVRLTEMLRQTVNDNAKSKVSMRSKLTIAEALLRSFHPGRTARVLGTILQSRKKPWMKALVLDRLVHAVHLSLWRKSRPNVSFVFLNAGAHIQHHYFFNCPYSGVESRNPAWYLDPKADPVLDMLTAYDAILADYARLADQGVRLILATGLTQVPYDRVKFYYRLSDHAAFLRRSGVRFARVLPRMTRDFEITFDNEMDAHAAADLLRGMTMARDGATLFKDVQDRGDSLFVSLTYGEEIQPHDVAVTAEGRRIEDFGGMVSFVAIKNGMHSTKGFAFISPATPAVLPKGPVHVSALYDLTLQASGA